MSYSIGENANSTYFFFYMNGEKLKNVFVIFSSFFNDIFSEEIFGMFEMNRIAARDKNVFSRLTPEVTNSQ